MIKKRRLCVGCHYDFYNHQGGIDGKGCWHLNDARVVHRTQVGTWQKPPYRWNPQLTLSCHQPDGTHWITSNDPRIAESDNDVST